MTLKFKHCDALHLNLLFTRFFLSAFNRRSRGRPTDCTHSAHPKRYRHWSFNQSAELAHLLCQQNQTDTFASEALTRPNAGPTQARLSRRQRQRSLAGTFTVPQDQRYRIVNRLVLLIDDVMTTGATLYKAERPVIGRKVARFAEWS